MNTSVTPARSTSATPVSSPPNDGGDKYNPARAASAAARWRRNLAETLGADPGGSLDEPRNRLTLLKIFGSTGRLADLCNKYPAAAAMALQSGPSSVIAEAARDLSALQGGVGGPDALHAALEPIKARVDLSVAIAEISDGWTTAEAATARAEFAERLVETALAWLLRGAVNRGELGVDLSDGFAKGVFALAGGDFAHEELLAYGPLDIAIFYDATQFAGQAASIAERAFVRLGTEFRDVFEGKSGELALFSLRTPLGTGVQGAGLVENLARTSNALNNDQNSRIRAFLATGRVVAGDREAGGQFLEQSEEAVWRRETALDDLVAQPDDADPSRAYRLLADILRIGLGRARPIFRTAPTRLVFEKASEAGVLPAAVAARLISGDDFIKSVVLRSQLMKGAASVVVSGEAEQSALASLCGFHRFSALQLVMDGFQAEAENAYPAIMEGPRAEFDRYKPIDDNPDDIDKLKDLGFSNGAFLCRVVDGWAGLSASSDEKRFASLAPGLLTAFGQTQHPDQAVKLFDTVINIADVSAKIMAIAGEDTPPRAALVDTLGCFGAATAPLTSSKEGAEILIARGGVEMPQSGAEWISRNTPPRTTSTEEIAAWRRHNIAAISKSAAADEISFGVAADALEAVHDVTLHALFNAIAGADSGLTLHVFGGACRGLPGEKTLFGFMNASEESADSEAVARTFIDTLHTMDEGFFAFAPNVTHRPGGVAGPLAPNLEAYRSYIQSEAVAHDQILLARARTIAGEEGAREKATAVLRTAVSNPKRADILFRDLDRARAQAMRRDRAASEWDIDKIDGGMTDVELIISTLVFRHAAAQPAIQNGGVDEALDLLLRGKFISGDVATTLSAARGFWRRIATIKALANWSDPQQEPLRPRFADLIAKAAEVDKFQQVKPLMRGHAEEVNRLYAQLVLGRPAATLVASA